MGQTHQEICGTAARPRPPSAILGSGPVVPRTVTEEWLFGDSDREHRIGLKRPLGVRVKSVRAKAEAEDRLTDTMMVGLGTIVTTLGMLLVGSAANPQINFPGAVNTGSSVSIDQGSVMGRKLEKFIVF